MNQSNILPPEELNATTDYDHITTFDTCKYSPLITIAFDMQTKFSGTSITARCQRNAHQIPHRLLGKSNARKY